MKRRCMVCESLTEKLENAKLENKLDLARIAYDQMREHKNRVKYPRKHGFLKSVKGT